MTMNEIIVITGIYLILQVYIGMRIGYEFAMHGDKYFTGLIPQTLGFVITVAIYFAIHTVVLFPIMAIFTVVM